MNKTIAIAALAAAGWGACAHAQFSGAAPAQPNLQSSPSLTMPGQVPTIDAMSAPPAPDPNAQRFTLDELIALAERDHPAIAAARAQTLAARAGVTAARAYPNPEVGYLGGSQRARQAGAATGYGDTVSITQRLENPALRGARVDAANAGVTGAEIDVDSVRNELTARIKSQYFEVLRREEEVAAAAEDVALTEQIRERVRVRTSTGEGARFDLLRADAEVGMAQKEAARARARLAQSRALLQSAVAARLPEGFMLTGDFYRRLPSANYQALKDSVLASNPALRRALAETTRAERQLDVEKNSVLPSVALQLQQDRQPDTNAVKAGIAISIPLWDRRRGQIDQANAQIIRARSEADLRRVELAQGFEAAWQQYQAAYASVQALEGGILEQSRRVVEIAEAAYRYGERGILEYLDARRQYRVARNELIAARYELHAAKAELERLAAADFRETRMER
jgi:cobalt-zinc-cadmium efflux system outer membrane protein